MVQLAELQKIEDILTSGRKPRGVTSFISLEVKKKKIERNLEARVLRSFYRLREKYDDAVVPVTKEHCPGCGMEITPLMRQEIRRGGEIKYCGCCGRILLWGGA